MKLYKVTDPEFKEYGRVISGYDMQDLIDGMLKTPCPEDGTIYVASDPALEALAAYEKIEKGLWGGLPVQIGYCNGSNTKLNALEYHRNSEINLAVGEDLILLLGKQQDLSEDYRLDTATVKAFLVPAGVMVEVYATSLHYAPCQTSDKGFRCVVVLPKGTNEDLTFSPEIKDGEERLLAAANKWLVVHPEGGQAAGTYEGLYGKNLDVTEDIN